MIPSSTVYDPARGDVRFDPATAMLMGTPQGARNAFGENVATMDERNPQWARWFDALQGMAGEQGKELRLGRMDGLPTDNHYGTLPLSLQNTPGAEYAYDSFGAPVAQTTGRGINESDDDQASLRQAAQPKPWSMNGAWHSMDFAPFRDPIALPDPSARRRT